MTRRPRRLKPSPAPVLGGNRWDDASGVFSTLYCTTTAEAAFGETIAPYRERPGLLERIDDFLSDEPDPEYDPELHVGVVPPDYLTSRILGHASVTDALFIDVNEPDTYAHATRVLPGLLAELGLAAFDRGVMMSPDRRVTRPVATLYRRYARTEGGSIRGLRYESRLESTWECWTMWRPLPLDLDSAEATTITLDNQELIAAADRLRLELPS